MKECKYCTRPVQYSGLCKIHYRRWREDGRPHDEEWVWRTAPLEEKIILTASKHTDYDEFIKEMLTLPSKRVAYIHKARRSLEDKGILESNHTVKVNRDKTELKV